jgi:toxin-antitoxin system PIN domain toxin
VIALDTNLLVYAHRRDSPFHDRARRVVEQLACGSSPWALPWPCIAEFFAVATHPRIYLPASTAEAAIDQVDAWLESPTVHLIAEGDAHWPVLRAMLAGGRVAGPAVHDARVAALCVAHGVSELWSAERDFTRFPAVRLRNPLVD